ncbi:MAG: GNAT family N-acetyltransferase [Azonexus sp.]
MLTQLPDKTAWPSQDDAGYIGLPVQTRAWMQARTNLVPAEAIRTFSINCGEQPAAVAPFVAYQNWLRELPSMFEPSDLIWSSQESLYRLAKKIARQSMPLQLERIPADSPTIPALRRAYRGRGLVITRPAMPTPVIDLALKDFETTLTTRRRSDLRRAERQAHEFGEVRYELHTPRSAEELDALMAEALSVEGRSWKVAAGTSLTTDAVQGSFFTRFTQAAMNEGHLRIALMRIDGQAVAMQIACEWNQRFWLFKISHDQAFSACSPGQLLIQHTLRQSMERGLLSYEFMGIKDRWTEHWTKVQRRYVHLYAIPFNPKTFKMLAKRLAHSAYGRFRRFAR